MKKILLIACVSSVAAADPAADRQRAIDDARKAGIVGTKGPQEQFDLYKLLGAVLECDGALSQGGKKLTFTGTMHEDSELDGAWLHEWFDGTAGPEHISFDAHLAFDPKTKQWTRLEVSNHGGYAIAHAGPLAGGKLEWESDATAAGGKAFKSKNHLDASDAKVVKVVGEVSFDGGKTYAKALEMTCKKPK